MCLPQPPDLCTQVIDLSTAGVTNLTSASSMQELRIDTHEGPYTAGSTVSGTLSLHSNGTYNVQKIRISFTGRCRVKIVERGFSEHIENQSDLYFFDEERVLLRGPYTLQAPHAWPFSFKFPDICDNPGIQGIQPW